jgi:hypothetical protein
VAQSQQQRVRNVVPKGPTPPRPRSKGSTTPPPTRANYARNVRQARDYGPTNVGKDVGSSVGTLEAEFFGAMLLIGLTIFFDPKASSDYSSVMLAAMKRGTLVIITFFLLALMSAAGPNAARFAKAFGALVIVALILAQAQDGMITKLDSFFKSDWTSGGASAGDSSANAAAGTQTSVPGSGAVGSAESAVEGAGSIVESNPFLAGNPGEVGLAALAQSIKNGGLNIGSAIGSAIKGLIP